MEEKTYGLRSKMEVSRSCTRCRSRPSPWSAAPRPGPASPSRSRVICACGREREIRDGLRARGVLRRLRRVVVPHAAGGNGEGTRALLPRRDRRRQDGRPASAWSNRVVPDERLEDDAVAGAEARRGPRVALRYMKRNMNAAETQSLAQCLDLEAMPPHAHRVRGPQGEAKAFVEKREPVFRGR